MNRLPHLSGGIYVRYQDVAIVNEVIAADTYGLTNLLLAAYEHDDRLKLLDGFRVIDVGANVGTFTLLARALLNADVTSVEPEPGNLEVLRLNVENVSKIVPLAVTGGASGTTLHSHASGPNAQCSGRVSTSDREAFRHGGGEEVEVEVGSVSIADLIDSRPVDLLKIDCEGCEWPILRNPGVSRWCRMIVFEYHPTAEMGGVHRMLRAVVEGEHFRPWRWIVCRGSSNHGLVFGAKGGPSMRYLDWIRRMARTSPGSAEARRIRSEAAAEARSGGKMPIVRYAREMSQAASPAYRRCCGG